MSDDAGIRRRVKEVIVRALGLQADPEEIPDGEAIFAGGIGADSGATLEVIFAIEEEFGIEVDDEDLRVELFDSVGTLAEYVKHKQEEIAGEPAPASAAGEDS